MYCHGAEFCPLIVKTNAMMKITPKHPTSKSHFIFIIIKKTLKTIWTTKIVNNENKTTQNKWSQPKQNTTYYKYIVMTYIIPKSVINHQIAFLDVPAVGTKQENKQLSKYKKIGTSTECTSHM